MIRRFVAALALAALVAPPVLAAPSAAPGGDLAQIKQRGELRVGADPTAGEPYYWLAGSNATGFEAELARAIARKLGLKATFVSTPWRDLLPAVKGGRIDLALNALEVRQDPEVQFSRPYYVASQAILVRTSDQRIYGLTDLAGRKVATTDGSVAAAILAKLKPAPQMRLFADTAAPFQDLAAGKSDAVLLESAMVRHHAQAEPKKFRLTGLPVLPRPYGIGMRKANAQLVAAVNKAIGDLVASHEERKILEKYNLWDSLQAGAAPAPAAKPSPSPLPAVRRRSRRHRYHRVH